MIEEFSDEIYRRPLLIFVLLYGISEYAYD